MNKQLFQIGALSLVVSCLGSFGVASLIAAHTARTFDASVVHAYDHVQKEARMTSRLFQPAGRARHGIRRDPRSGS